MLISKQALSRIIKRAKSKKIVEKNCQNNKDSCVAVQLKDFYAFILNKRETLLFSKCDITLSLPVYLIQVRINQDHILFFYYGSAFIMEFPSGISIMYLVVFSKDLPFGVVFFLRNCIHPNLNENVLKPPHRFCRLTPYFKAG